jgi:hypothetical protein
MKSIKSMKIHISLILTGLFVAMAVCAQNPETLTNGSVIKMTKARLADELIIDMINNSPAMFDLSPGALRSLEGEGVSEAVIQSMKGASSLKAEPDRAEPATGNKPVSAAVNAVEQDPKPPTVPSTEENPEPSGWMPSATVGEASVEALNYTAPLTELIKFYVNKYESTELTLSEWDRQVRGYIADISKVRDQMLQVENEMRSLKNADTRVFSNDIISLKGKLAAYRKNYRQSKDIMIKGGGNIVKQIETMSGDVAKDIGKAFSAASQQVTSSDLDPSSGEKPVTVDYTVKEAGAGCVSYMVYMNEMLAWYQNAIRDISNLAEEWNPRVIQVIREDNRLKSQAEPIEKRIEELSSNQKQNKAEISDLKKQLSAIEKSRKQIADRMKDDAKELAGNLKKMSQTGQAAAEERFADIIENITYSFGEKLSL